MRKLTLLLTLSFIAPITLASELVLTAQHHYVARPDKTPMAAIFTDERVIVNLRLDVFVVPNLPSSKAHYGELAPLTQSTWLAANHWELLSGNGKAVALPTPTLLRNDVRFRGPNAPRQVDRDRTVDYTTFEASFDFGRLPVGDYTFRASLAGLTSSFPISVRTGQEPEVHDTYLTLKAQRASTFAEYRDIQMERYRNDPTHIEPIFMALDRALTDGSFDDARSLLSLATEKIDERRRAAPDGKKREFFSARLTELRRAQRSLPDYFAHRAEWVMTRDMAAGGYVIKDRKSGALLQRFAATQ
jgi:hypothetical protein